LQSRSRSLGQEIRLYLGGWENGRKKKKGAISHISNTGLAFWAVSFYDLSQEVTLRSGVEGGCKEYWIFITLRDSSS
jgi:hypothetical protein